MHITDVWFAKTRAIWQPNVGSCSNSFFVFLKIFVQSKMTITFAEEFDHQHDDWVIALAVWNQWLCSASFDSTIRIWNEDNKVVRVLQGHEVWEVGNVFFVSKLFQFIPRLLSVFGFWTSFGCCRFLVLVLLCQIISYTQHPTFLLHPRCVCISCQFVCT